ncbi:MAG: hypothetical protein U9N87_09380 [Planctomycetota bacterium]|nr:hypothetical protein [Planctomycetota bacterium]
MYLFLDLADTCVERVLERVQKGGHAVPEADIRRRFVRSIRNFWRLHRPLTDHCFLVYHSGNQPIDVAAGGHEDISVRDTVSFSPRPKKRRGKPGKNRNILLMRK